MLTHQIANGCEVFTDRLDTGLLWNEETFSARWNSHPEERHVVRMFGRPITVARWQQAYGTDYGYSGTRNVAQPIPVELLPLLGWASYHVDERLNGLLVNWYDGPRDHISCHRDDARDLVPAAPIVTISFGETRTFRLEQGRGSERLTRDIDLRDGDVLILPAATNRAWKHSVPARQAYRGRRISVTLRAFV
ncbi:alpha-ketoglutarate-dependent dioxygenase AlkB [uncultured Jatrophihabitans sp.]|uniref:alpha-ketoglutarate-dependent dioxygenase AlkB n=1 Tax=uncultured Jatrophihabitans sp. TaxID=1610747 RepID=UPI0035CB3D9C